MSGPTFEFQKLEVYQLARSLQPLIGEIVAQLPRGSGDLRSQLLRSERSIRFNIAEGAGRNSAGGKAERYRTARGSANECAAALDEIEMSDLAPQARIREAAVILHRIVSMLTRLIMTWESRR